MENLIEITDELAAMGIYSVVHIKDDDGDWIFVNGESGYSTEHYTPEEAVADYLTPEAEEARLNLFYRANGFWD